MRIPVLTYHAAFVNGSNYQDNNLMAFAEDLRLVDRLGLKIIPLTLVVRALVEGHPVPQYSVAISLDDGTDFDYVDLHHPVFGLQRSFLNTMRDFVAEFGSARQPTLHATSFVIASPAARDELDKRCLMGAHWYNDTWWAAAVSTNLMGIANHSWDHNHPDTTTLNGDVGRGTFRSIDNVTLADHQIRLAQNYLINKAPNPATALFAYPYGESNDYLEQEYFPRFGRELGIAAAFSTQPAPITEGASRWNLPRFVCAADWKSRDDLARILRDAF